VTVAAGVAGTRRWPGVLAWGLWALVLLGFTPALWLGHLLRQAGRPDLVSGIVETVPYLLGLVSAATVGAVLASRRPRHPVGWLLLALGLSVTFTRVAEGYARYGLLARPGALPAAIWAALCVDSGWVAFAVCIGFVLLLTPTGSLPSPRLALVGKGRGGRGGAGLSAPDRDAGRAVSVS
jgi:hypothetical protein